MKKCLGVVMALSVTGCAGLYERGLDDRTINMVRTYEDQVGMSVNEMTVRMFTRGLVTPLELVGAIDSETAKMGLPEDLLQVMPESTNTITCVVTDNTSTCRYFLFSGMRYDARADYPLTYSGGVISYSETTRIEYDR